MENTNLPTNKMSRSFILWWVLANMVGLPILALPFGVGMYLITMLAIISDGGTIGVEFYIFSAVIFVLIELFLGGWFGLFQWLVLQRHMQIGAKWIWTTAVGMAVGSLLGGLVFAWIFSSPIVNRPDGIYFSFAYEYVSFGMMLGLCIGVMQWFVLRREVYKAGLWIILLPISFTLGMFLADLGKFSSGYAMFIFILLALIGVGLSTGGLLSWLFRRSKK